MGYISFAGNISTPVKSSLSRNNQFGVGNPLVIPGSKNRRNNWEEERSPSNLKKSHRRQFRKRATDRPLLSQACTKEMSRAYNKLLAISGVFITDEHVQPLLINGPRGIRQMGWFTCGVSNNSRQGSLTKTYHPLSTRWRLKNRVSFITASFLTRPNQAMGSLRAGGRWNVACLAVMAQVRLSSRPGKLFQYWIERINYLSQVEKWGNYSGVFQNALGVPQFRL